MSLLVDLTTGALDPSYAGAARRRSSDVGPSSRRPHAWVLVVLLLLGSLGGVALSQARRSAPAADSVRRSLADDVRQQTTATDLLARQTAVLRSDVDLLRTQVLSEGATGRAAAARLQALELAGGFLPVTGPGVVVTLDDARDGTGNVQSRGGRAGKGRLYDRDLQEAVNALWAAGAEAIGINGQRLTGLTAIRSAGEAILVDLRPLSPPYVLRAVGNVDVLEPAFADSPAARRFSTYTSLYGIGFDVRRAVTLDLPAAAVPQLRIAAAAP